MAIEMNQDHCSFQKKAQFTMIPHKQTKATLQHEQDGDMTKQKTHNQLWRVKRKDFTEEFLGISFPSLHT
jgi:hypothetical protein